MLTKPFFPRLFLVLLLVLPCLFGNGALGRKMTLVTREVRIQNSGEIYVVIFDAGSSGTRVHVFRFDENINILPINGELDVQAKVTPGLSSYSDNPKEAASSIAPLLEKAVNTVPVKLRLQTPVKLGATAGLRLIGEEKSEKILHAVQILFSNSSLWYEKDWVVVISGTEEGTYMWVTMNYLLGHLGNEYSKTVGVVDLGGASVQMAYAISAETASNAPTTGEEYISKHHLRGTNYNLYVHSYLRYGQDAARAEILKSTNDSVNYCILSGYNGKYKYNGALYNARSSSSGSNYDKCRENVLEALNLNANCEVQNCTFNGVWNGGGGAGQDKLYLATAFYYRAADFNIINSKAGSGEATPADFKRAAAVTCALKSQEEASTKYPNVWTSNLPFVCMDLVYQYTLLTSGFGLDDEKSVTLIDKVKYGDFYPEASWPLGSAIQTVSTMSSTKQEAKNMFRFWSHA
ncbi:apyrase 3 [Carex littledalei]|uniref:Apyrase 3 n=1 Tax=Carex littledalei TaxID=544730 RepID=A0A833QIP6_9POAL|nr:apyrase 3 [Carex littledalei]